MSNIENIIIMNYTNFNLTEVNLTEVNLTEINLNEDFNLTEVNLTEINLNEDFNFTDNSTCVDNTKKYNIDYNYKFIDITPDMIIQICYTIFTFLMICTVHIKYKSIFFAVVLLPFIGWYTFTIHRYLMIFDYLNKMNEVTYCQDISDKIYTYEISAKVFLPLITVFTVIYIVLLTRENTVRHMRVDTNTNTV
jgi:hypothetical protein